MVWVHVREELASIQLQKIASEHLRCNIKDLSYLTGRTPLRPFPLDKAIGDYEYEEITKVEAAPL